MIPLISGGPGRQYLLHEAALAAAVIRAVRGEFDGERRPVTLAHPDPVPLKEVLAALAANGGRKVVFFPVSWRLVYFALRLLEQLRLDPGFTSDSLVSFVFQNPAPDFQPAADHDIQMISFNGAIGAAAARRQS